MVLKSVKFVSLACLAALLALIVVSPVIKAQAPDRGPGPNEQPAGQSRDSDSDNDGDSTPIPPGASVSGFVYNDGLRPQAGVAVVLEGGGWRAETVTDSNGFYQFAGLGRGQGKLNLILPPDKEPILPDWPVTLTSGADIRLNLGYVSGGISHLPVLLSGQLENNLLKVQIKNRIDELATNGVVDVKLPPDIQLGGSAEASRGQVASRANGVKLNISSIEPGEIVTLDIRLATQAAQQSSLSDNINIFFTYDQQIMPQLVTLPSEVSLNQNIEKPLPVTGELQSHTGGSIIFVIISSFVIFLLFTAGGLSFTFTKSKN